jgi:uncharacterized protein (TIGR03000 family)
MRCICSVAVIGLLTAGGWLALTEEASAQRGRGRGGWYGGRGGYGPGYYDRGYGYGYGYGYGGYGYGYPGVTFGGRNWGITVPFDSGSSYYDRGYYSSRPYYYSNPQTYAQGGYEEASPQNSAQIEVIVPDPNAEVRFNGHATREMGRRRMFFTAPLEAGYKYSYEVDARWQQDGQSRSDSRTVQIQPGGRAVVDFTRQQASTPSDRRDSGEAQEPRQTPPQRPQTPQQQRQERPPQTPEDAPPIP